MTERSYAGRWLLVQFGFTHCRLVCPRALAKLTIALGAVDSPQRRSLTPLYITVDPERDTPAVLRAHLQQHHPDFTGLTGPPEAIERTKDVFRVFAKRREDPEDPDGYAVPHTAITYLVDPNSRAVAHWADTVDAESIAADLNRSLAAPPVPR